jgi:hypothetical protein
VLTAAHAYRLVTKSNLILGMGETSDEVRATLTDLHDASCDIVTITQYLRPSGRHHLVARWVKPEEFVEHEQFAQGLGFAGVPAGPLVGPPIAPGGFTRRRSRVVSGPKRQSVSGVRCRPRFVAYSLEPFARNALAHIQCNLLCSWFIAGDT